MVNLELNADGLVKSPNLSCRNDALKEFQTFYETINADLLIKSQLLSGDEVSEIRSIESRW